MTTPEGKIKDMVKKAMASQFPKLYHFMPVQNGMGSPSLDFLYCIDGLFVAIETKASVPGRSKPRMTDRQRFTADQIEAAGGLAFLVYDYDSLARAMAQIQLRLHQ